MRKENSYFIFVRVIGLHMVLGLYVSRERVVQRKFLTLTPPPPLSRSNQPAWGGAAGQAAGGRVGAGRAV